MDTTRNEEKKNYLSSEVIKTFVFANILHAIDNDYLKLDINKVVVTCKPFLNDMLSPHKYVVGITAEKEGKDGMTEWLEMPYESTNELDQLRSMMGLTMKILTVLEAYADVKPVLRVVK